MNLQETKKNNEENFMVKKKFKVGLVYVFIFISFLFLLKSFCILIITM